MRIFSSECQVAVCFLDMQFNFTVLVYFHCYFIKSQQDSFIHDKNKSSFCTVKSFCTFCKYFKM